MLSVYTCPLVPRPPRLARPPSASPQANAGRAWLAGELAWQAGWRSRFVISLYFFRAHLNKDCEIEEMVK